ncbi:MAG: hypothetical protein CMK59_09590 [Proteobacteria bacterium]|nr:hypothetical protein [Pseudomonadota bacterium]
MFIVFIIFNACKTVEKGFEFSNEDGELNPSASACHPDVAGWSTQANAMEFRVIDLINQRRSQEVDCRTGGFFGPAQPLSNHVKIQCAARYHAWWMAQNDVLSHDSPDGDLGFDFWQRAESAGYGGWAVGENVAAGYSSAEDVVAGWMSSDGHCANIMEPTAQEIGVGYSNEPSSSMQHFWSMTTGSQ